MAYEIDLKEIMRSATIPGNHIFENPKDANDSYLMSAIALSNLAIVERLEAIAERLNTKEDVVVSKARIEELIAEHPVKGNPPHQIDDFWAGWRAALKVIEGVSDE